MNKRKLFFAIGVIAVILLGSTFFALNQRGKEEKKEKKDWLSDCQLGTKLYIYG